MVAEALQAAEEGEAWEGPQDGDEVDLLSQQYTSLLQRQLESLHAAEETAEEEEWNARLGDFSRALLGAPDIRREVEPLVAFLVIFAKSQHLDER